MNHPGGPRVLVISSTADFATDSLAAYPWAMAEALSAGHDVILAVPELTAVSHGRFAVVYYNDRNIGLLVRDSDVVIFSSAVAARHSSLIGMGTLRAAPVAALKKGNLKKTRSVGNIESPGNLGGQEYFVLLPALPRQAAPGLFYYLARLRYHLRRGRRPSGRLAGRRPD